jgi:DNA-binding beta-propeller fold protein YncE
MAHEASGPTGWSVVAGGPESSIPLAHPSGVAIDAQERIWITDEGTDRLLVLSPGADLLGEWRGPGRGPGQLQNPSGLAVDANGSVYVAEVGNNRIQKFSGTGDVMALWGDAEAIPDLRRFPVAVAVGRDLFVYVARAGGRFGLRHMIVKMDQTGQIVQAFGPGPDYPWGSQPGQFTAPYGVAVDVSGNVYVADSGNNRIQKLGADGAVLAIWGSKGQASGELERPMGLALDPDGNVYVADTDNHRIQVLSPDGSVLEVLGQKGTGLGEFDAPWGLTVTADGTLYVADAGNKRVVMRSSSPETRR